MLPGQNLGRYNRLSQMLAQPAGLWANNGTVTGGLAAALQQGLQGFIAGREQRDSERQRDQYDAASQAFLGAQSADEAFANLSALQDNPYAPQFLMQMAPGVWERRAEDQRRQQLMGQLFGGGQAAPASSAPARLPPAPQAPAGGTSSYIDAVGGYESGNNPTIRNTVATELGLPQSQIAAGQYQFLPSTWAPYAQEMGLPLDPAAATPEQQRAVMERFTADNEAIFRQQMGRAPNDAERYLMHFQGPGGAVAILQADPNTPLYDILTAVDDVGYANAVFQQNPNLPRDITAGGVIRMMYDHFPQSVSAPPGGVTQAPAQGAAPQAGGLSPQTAAMLFSGDPVFERLGIELAAQELAGGERQDLPSGMIYGPDGRPMWVPEYLEGREQIAQAGRSEFRIGDDAPPALAQDDLAAYSARRESFDSLDSLMYDFDRVEQILDQGLVYTGPGANVRLWLNQVAASLGDEEAAGRASGAEVIRSIQSRLAPSMRETGSGSSSDRDVQMFIDSLPNLANTPQGNRLIIEGIRRVRDRRQQELRIARQYFSTTGFLGTEQNPNAYLDDLDALGPLWNEQERALMGGGAAPSSQPSATNTAQPPRPQLPPGFEYE